MNLVSAGFIVFQSYLVVASHLGGDTCVLNSHNFLADKSGIHEGVLLIQSPVQVTIAITTSIISTETAYISVDTFNDESSSDDFQVLVDPSGGLSLIITFTDFTLDDSDVSSSPQYRSLFPSVFVMGSIFCIFYLLKPETSPFLLRTTLATFCIVLVGIQIVQSMCSPHAHIDIELPSGTTFSEVTTPDNTQIMCDATSIHICELYAPALDVRCMLNYCDGNGACNCEDQEDCDYWQWRWKYDGQDCTPVEPADGCGTFHTQAECVNTCICPDVQPSTGDDCTEEMKCYYQEKCCDGLGSVESEDSCACNLVTKMWNCEGSDENVCNCDEQCYPKTPFEGDSCSIGQTNHGECCAMYQYGYFSSNNGDIIRCVEQFQAVLVGYQDDNFDAEELIDAIICKMERHGYSDNSFDVMNVSTTDPLAPAPDVAGNTTVLVDFYSTPEAIINGEKFFNLLNAIIALDLEYLAINGEPEATCAEFIQIYQVVEFSCELCLRA